MTTHHVTITEHHVEIVNFSSDNTYQSVCSCRWHGWAVLDLDQAYRQRDRHLEQAEIDARTLSAARARGDGEPES
jgi:hypothetical protein